MSEKVYSLDEIRHIAAPIAARHGVDALYLFGSYARGDATPKSDLDFRIEKGRIRTLYQLAGFEMEMEESFDKRLAAFLLEEAAIEGTSTLRLTHETIGNHLGHPREVVTRMLRYFQAEGMVRLSRGVVEIVDERALRRLAA